MTDHAKALISVGVSIVAMFAVVFLIAWSDSDACRPTSPRGPRIGGAVLIAGCP